MGISHSDPAKGQMGHLPYVKGHMNITEGQTELEVKSIVCLGALEEAE